MKKKILLTGAKGMLGRTVARRLKDHELILTDIEELDVTNSAQVRKVFSEERPDIVVHCAAMTAVDECESKSDLAFKLNDYASGLVARNAQNIGAYLISVSTDYVFDGFLDQPYNEEYPPGPATIYGASKWAGEIAIAQDCERYSILRIAWLYGEGGPSFFHTMAKLLNQHGESLKVVDDQIGNPTTCDVVAEVINEYVEKPLYGISHCTTEGEASWYDFAREIRKQLDLKREITPCTTEEFPRPAQRPANSRLDNMVRRKAGRPNLPHWQEALSSFIETYPYDLDE